MNRGDAEVETSARYLEQERQLAEAEAAAHLGRWRWRVGTEAVEWSDGMYQIHGLNRDDFTPSLSGVFDLLHPDDRIPVRGAFDRVLRDRRVFDSEFRIRRPDGSLRRVWCYADCSAERRSAGDWILGILQDITELRQAELAALESAAHYRQLVELLPDGVILCQGGRIVFCNPATVEILGAASAEVLAGKPARDLAEPADREALDQLLEHPPEKARASRPVEMKLRRLDGSVFEGEVQATAMHSERGPAIELILRDVSRRKAMQQQFDHAQRMEVVGQLTGGIAHDFNNILGIIIGNLDLLIERAKGDPALIELANVALDGALRGADLTQRLLAFSRKQPQAPRPIDLNAVLNQIVSVLRRTLGEQIEIRLDLAPQLMPIFAEPMQIEDAILNLAINARDAMPEGGRLSIETCGVILEGQAGEPAGLAPGRYAVLTVSDTGTGMSAEVAGRAFEPFFTTKSLGKGTGLGLSMVYGFVKRSNGHIEIDSHPGGGTRVRIHLPQVPAGRQEIPAAPLESAGSLHPAAGRVVLVVEDEKDVRTVAVKQLHDLGCRTLEAENAKAALSLLDSQEKVDLLFSDVVMPGGMNGYDLAVEARKRRPGLKVLLASGYAAHSRVQRAEPVEDIELLNKPYRKRDLAQKLGEVLGRAK
jgi:PAS domain S-box-containing protein